MGLRPLQVHARFCRKLLLKESLKEVFGAAQGGGPALPPAVIRAGDCPTCHPQGSPIPTRDPPVTPTTSAGGGGGDAEAQLAELVLGGHFAPLHDHVDEQLIHQVVDGRRNLKKCRAVRMSQFLST